MLWETTDIEGEMDNFHYSRCIINWNLITLSMLCVSIACISNGFSMSIHDP